MAFFLEDIWVSSHDLLIRTPVTGYGPSLNQYDLILTIYICYFQISLYAEVLGRREFGGGALFNSVQNICFEGVSFYVVGLFVYIWCWSWNSSTLATSCEELTHWKRLWCWEGLGAGGEGDDRGWDGWMASLTRWMQVWVNSGSWWWTESPGVLWFMGSQRVGHDWAAELNWLIACSLLLWF